MYGINITGLMKPKNVIKTKENITDIEKEQIIIQLMDTYGKDVLRTAFFFVKDKTLADDIFQEVFIKIYKCLDTYRNQAAIKTWILRITINQSKDYLKSNWFKRLLAHKGTNKSAEKPSIAKDSPFR